MRRLATVVAFLMVAGVATAQPGTGPYAVTGRVVAPNLPLQSDFDVHLVNDADIVVASVRAHADEQFIFRGLSAGTYFLDVSLPGFRSERQRVDFMGGEREAHALIILDPQPDSASASPAKAVSPPDVVNVKDLPRSPQLLKKFQEANKKLEGGDFDGARVQLESIVAKDPGFYDAHNSLGTAYQRSHKYPEAEKEYQAAHELRPTMAFPLILMGSLYLEQEEAGAKDMLEKARIVMKRAVELNPQIGFARYLLGVACLKSALYTEAESNLSRALELEPKLPDIRLALANLYIRTEAWANAVKQLDAFLKENPQAPQRERVIETRTRIAQGMR